jgi:hypothetical protein
MTWSTPTPPSPIEGEGARCWSTPIGREGDRCWSATYLPSPLAGAGCRCATDLSSPLAGAGCRCATSLRFALAGAGCRCATDLRFPLAGEGQGGGEPTFHARMEARPWPLRSPVGCVRISPTPSSGSGLGCADGSSTDAASGDRLPWVLTSSTSRVSQRGWSSRLMEASTAGGPRKMLREALGSRPMDSTSCASGTTRCSATWRGCWRRSGGPCRIERRIDPPPRPSPARGEGMCSMPRGEGVCSMPRGDRVRSMPRGQGVRSMARGQGVCSVPPGRGVCSTPRGERVCSMPRREGVCSVPRRPGKGGDRLTSAPRRDRVDRLGLVPRRRWLAAEKPWLGRNGILSKIAHSPSGSPVTERCWLGRNGMPSPLAGEGQGGGCAAAAGASAAA